MSAGNLLVVGAREGSLGDWVARVALQKQWIVSTAGISGYEDHYIDITNSKEIGQLIFEAGCAWDSVVCTVGINEETKLGHLGPPGFRHNLIDILMVNTVSVLDLLNSWIMFWTAKDTGVVKVERISDFPQHFVAISSNSAHVARSGSLGYCASKAALSMGLRCAARAMAHSNLNIYGYEPGWLSGTPMSKVVNKRIAPGISRHRIPGQRTVDPSALAHMIVNGINNPYSSLNGCMIRVDGGEQ